MSRTTVSIIVPVYNGGEQLSQTITSLLTQTYEFFEILLIDDGSTDDSQVVVRKFLSDSRVKYHRKENGGVASARNYGIKLAKGEFIAFCDQDDQWLPDKLTYQLPLFENARVGLVYSWVEVRKYGEITISRPFYQGLCFDELLNENFISCCTVLVRKSLLDLVGGFDESRDLSGADDRHVWLRVARLAELAVVKKPLAIYFLHGQNFSLNEKKMWKADLASIRKIASIDSLTASEKTRCKHAEFNIHCHYANNLLYQNDTVAAANCYFSAWKVNLPHIECLVLATFLYITPAPIIGKIKIIKKRLTRFFER